MIIFNISPTRTQTPGERKPSPFKSLRLPAILKRPHTHGFASWNRTAECTRYLNVCRVLRVVCHTFLVHVYHLVQMELIQATRTDSTAARLGETTGSCKPLAGIRIRYLAMTPTAIRTQHGTRLKPGCRFLLMLAHAAYGCADEHRRCLWLFCNQMIHVMVLSFLMFWGIQ